MDDFTLDVVCYNKFGKDNWAQERYLVHGYDDVMWTSNIEEVIAYLKSELERFETEAT